ncbi:hypothetical protein, partial [Streptococcus suis]
LTRFFFGMTSLYISNNSFSKIYSVTFHKYSITNTIQKLKDYISLLIQAGMITWLVYELYFTSPSTELEL